MNIIKPKTVDSVLKPFLKAVNDLDSVCAYHQDKSKKHQMEITDLLILENQSKTEALRAAKLAERLRSILE